MRRSWIWFPTTTCWATSISLTGTQDPSIQFSTSTGNDPFNAMAHVDVFAGMMIFTNRDHEHSECQNHEIFCRTGKLHMNEEMCILSFRQHVMIIISITTIVSISISISMITLTEMTLTTGSWKTACLSLAASQSSR